MRIRRKIDDQVKIQKALEENDVVTLWKEVAFIGYNRIPSVAERKLVFLRCYQDYDPDINDNFVAYYDKCIHYTSLLNWQKSTNPFKISDETRKRLEDRELWPDPENLFPDPKNRQEDICNKYAI